MSYYPFSLTSFRAPTIYPDTPNTTSIRNSPGRDSARGQGSSILTNGGFDDNKSSPSVRSLISTRNEEFPAFSGLSFGPGTSIQGRDSDFRRPNSFAGAPLSLQDGGFQSSQSFPTGFPSGVDQPDTTAGHATVVSIFCHDCGLFFRGVREEGVEVLDRHRCTGTGPINGGYAAYADNFDFLPLVHSNQDSNGRWWRSDREDSGYSQPNLNHAGSGIMTVIPPEAHGFANSYSDGPYQPTWGQGIPRRRRFRFSPSQNDLDYQEVAGPPPMFGSIRDADALPASESEASGGGNVW